MPAPSRPLAPLPPVRPVAAPTPSPSATAGEHGHAPAGHAAGRQGTGGQAAGGHATGGAPAHPAAGPGRHGADVVSWSGGAAGDGAPDRAAERPTAGAHGPVAARAGGSAGIGAAGPLGWASAGRVTRATYAGAAARAATTPPWSARAEAVAHWCLSRRPLTPAALRLLGEHALEPWVARGARDTLGALLRAALGAGEGGLVALYDALADAGAPTARALLARVLGAPFLLVTARVRRGTLVGADARACADEREALGLLAALGAHEPGRGALMRGLVIGSPADREPVALLADDDVSLLAAFDGDVGEGDALLALPLLDLDAGQEVESAAPEPARAPAEPPGAGWPTAMGVGSPFLEAFDPRLMGRNVEPPRPAPPATADEDDEADRPAAKRRRSRDDARDDDARDATRDSARQGRGHPAPEEEPSDDDGPDDGSDEDVEPSPFLGAEGADFFGSGGVTAPTWVGAPAPEPEPEPAPEPDVAAAALARVRARAAAVQQRVTATVATDDGVLDTVVDVVPWLSNASEGELRTLLADRWQGDAAVDMAHALAEDDPEVDEVVRQARRTETELVVEVDGRAAAAWLVQHRPEVAERLGLG